MKIQEHQRAEDYNTSPLLAFSSGCVVGRLLCREKRFFVAALVHGRPVWAHTNNTGSMLGLLRPGAPVLLSPASNPERKLRWTVELIWCGGGFSASDMPEGEDFDSLSLSDVGSCEDFFPDSPRATSVLQELLRRREVFSGARGFWVGVNTSIPNKLLEAAFWARKLPWAVGYTSCTREKAKGQSRLDALLEGPDLPRLWVECKNVTLAEDGVALFPDAVTSRGLKHLEELMVLPSRGERAAMFYLVQRADGHCFAPAEMIDPSYAAGFYAAQATGVEMYPHVAELSARGIGLSGDCLNVLGID